MALFGFLDGVKSGLKRKSITVSTTDFDKGLAAACKKLALLPDEIDFKLSKVETQINYAQSDGFEPISSQHIDLLKSKEDLLSPEVQFKQVYTIVFEKKQPHKYRLNALLEADSAHSMAKAKILKSSVFPTGGELKKWLVYELNRFKVRHGIMLQLFDWNMKKETDMLVSYLQKHGGRLEKDVEVSLSRWPVPATRTIDDNLIYHFEKQAAEESSKVNHAEQNYSNFITEGNLLIEYIKPKEGVTGREYSGRLIEAHEPVVSHDVMFNADSATIETKEDEAGIKFYAKKDGYVMLEEGLLKITDDLEVTSIDLKSTGNIRSNMDKDISITVKGDATEDKIGPNMKVEVANLSIGGSIAEGSEIRSKNLVIGGQTHLSSKVYTEKAEIKVHKGYLEAREALIATIENGKIYADTIQSNTAIGAELHGKRVAIKEIKSHCLIEFSHTLEIGAVTGNENKFILTPFAQKEEGEALEKAIISLSEKKQELLKLNAKHEHYTVVIRKNQPILEEISHNIKEAKSKKLEPAPAILKRFEELVNETKVLQKLGEKTTQIKAEIAELDEIVQVAQDKLLQAVITIDKPWQGFNEIYFQMISPKQTIKYLPKERSGPESIAIGLDEEGNYEVKRRVGKAENTDRAETPEKKPETAPQAEQAEQAEQTEQTTEASSTTEDMSNTDDAPTEKADNTPESSEPEASAKPESAAETATPSNETAGDEEEEEKPDEAEAEKPSGDEEKH